MKEIQLTQGKVAVIDDQDYEKVSNFKWYLTNPGTKWFYARSKQNGKAVSLHRFIMGFPNGNVDHINGNGLDNRRQNLRIVNQSQNTANSRKTSEPRTSKFKGVYLHRKARKWVAMIRKNYKAIYIGIFENEKDAALAYDSKAKELFGEHALLNLGRER